MTDWEKLKVVELKDELKSRDIPLTGLKLKQQLIDKLVEYEAASHSAETGGETPAEATDAQPTEDSAQSDGLALSKEDSMGSDTKISDDGGVLKEDVVADDTDMSIEPKAEGSRSIEVGEIIKSPVTEVKHVEEEEAPARDDSSIPEQITETSNNDRDETTSEGGQKMGRDEMQQPEDAIMEESNAVSPTPMIEGDATPEVRDVPNEQIIETQSVDEALVPTEVPTPEILEDQRKRKRRSMTPVPDMDDLAHKKAKMSTGEAVVTKHELSALEQIQAATHEAQANRATNDPDTEPIRPMQASDDPVKTRVAREVGGMPDASELDNSVTTREESGRTRSLQYSKQETAPAIHPTTSSLYIRNFKRPLHIPTLRSHVLDLARSSSDGDSDPITIFYLDSIRTHAFISFTSTSAAIGVRSALHETRFPDEPMRDPLWVDFIPDEKVQTWIDQETGIARDGFGGGRGRGNKFEVSYRDSAHGVEALLQDASQLPSRPSYQQQTSRGTSQDATNFGAAPGVHPDRIGFVPQDSASRPVRSESQRHAAPPRSDVGKGFKALDELFSSTTTKPKLYFKTVSQATVDDRLDMLRDLRVGHSEMGRSGDEGMKRYTFETYKGRDQWVDKGPEFGFGRKGQDRLAGTGYRGRGGGSGGFRGARRGGGDSWRGR